MKTLFFLLIPFLCISQTVTQRDTVVDVGGTLYLQHIITTSELLLDTFKIRARINEIDAQISQLQAERAKKVQLIGDFEELKPEEMIRTPGKQTLPKPKKSVPKKQYQGTGTLPKKKN